MKGMTVVDRQTTELTGYTDRAPKLGHVVSIGSALGGGLAKLFEYIYGKHSVSSENRPSGCPVHRAGHYTGP
jgi:hypothetical protein